MKKKRVLDTFSWNNVKKFPGPLPSELKIPAPSHVGKEIPPPPLEVKISPPPVRKLWDFPMCVFKKTGASLIKLLLWSFSTSYVIKRSLSEPVSLRKYSTTTKTQTIKQYFPEPQEKFYNEGKGAFIIYRWGGSGGKGGKNIPREYFFWKSLESS